MQLLILFTVLPSVTGKQRFYASISCECRKYRSLPFNQTAAPLLPPQSQPPPFAYTQSLLAPLVLLPLLSAQLHPSSLHSHPLTR